MKAHDICIPGVLLSQIEPETRKTQAETLRLLERVLKKGFFKAVQTVEVPFAGEREAIGRLVKESGIIYTYCITRVLGENGLNISSTDEELRNKSVSKAVAMLGHATDCNATYMSVISGPRPVLPEDRARGLEALSISMRELCLAAKPTDIGIVIEPLDYDAHKKNSLGTYQEAFELCKAMQDGGLELHLCLDAAHLTLNGEEVADAARLCGIYTSDFHLCNCVTSPEHPLFGDRHMMFGSPGVFGLDEFAQMVKALCDVKLMCQERKITLACEILNTGEMDAAELLDYCEKAIIYACTNV